jgi:hypothetical protein
MFRLHKAAIIRLYVSENVKSKLYSCVHIMFIKYMGEISALQKFYVNVKYEK